MNSHEEHERPSTELKWGCWTHVFRFHLERFFFAVGTKVGTHPKRAMLIGLVIAIACSLSLIRGLSLTNSNLIWVPRGTQGWSDYQEIQKLFPLSGDRADDSTTVVIFSANDANNLLTPSSLLSMWDVDAALRGLTDSGGNNLLEAACDRPYPGANCSVINIFSLLGLTTRAQVEDFNFTESVFQQQIPDSFYFGLGPSTDPADGASAYLKATRSLYILNDLTIDPTLAWENAANAALFDRLPELEAEGVTVTFFNLQLLDDETGELVSKEYPLVGGTVVLLMAYMCAVLGRSPPVKSRILLGSSVVITVLLSLIMSFGLLKLFDVMFTVLSPLLIFVLLGVGVDDMIIIVDAFDRTAQYPHIPSDDVVARMAYGLKEAGYAISVTSITSFAAFLFASNVDMPAITAFCQLGAMGIFSVFVLQLTVFSGLLTLDERRIIAGRYDVCPCVRSASAKTATTADVELASSPTLDIPSDMPSLEVTSSTTEVGLDRKAKNAAPASLAASPSAQTSSQSHLSPAHEVQYEGRVRLFLVNQLAPVMANPWKAAAVVAGFLLFFAVATYFALQVGTEADLSEFFPESFMSRQFASDIRVFFGDQERVCGIYTADLDYTQGKVRQDLWRIRNESRAIGLARPPENFWLEVLETWTRTQGYALTDSNFTTTLHRFLEAPPFTDPSGQLGPLQVIPQEQTRNLVFSPEGTLIGQRFTFQIAWSSQQAARVDVTREARDLAGRYPQLSAIAFASGFLYTDRDTEIPEMIVFNLAFACIGVVLVLLLLLPTSMTMLLTLCIVMVDLDVIGLLSVAGDSLDITSFTTLAMSLGLSVDFTVHVTNEYSALRLAAAAAVAQGKQAQLTPQEDLLSRIRLVYANIGTSVFNGGLSTFLGVCLLAGAQSPAFRIFFRVLLGTTLFGVAHGLFFAVAVLSLHETLTNWWQQRKVTHT